MQTDATGSHPPVSDMTPWNSALSSLIYSDQMDRQVQNHVMAGVPLPPSFGEEFWSSQLARTSPFPFESPKSVVNSTFEGVNCSYQGLPFDGSTKWDFSRGASDHQIQESSMMNEWMWTEQGRSRLDSVNPGPSRLSLSLATAHPPSVVVHGATIINQDQGGGSDLSSSGVTSYSLQKRHVGSDNTSCSSNNLSLDFTSCKTLPLAGSGSRFFQAMQEILVEFARYALEDHDDHHHRVSLASRRAAEFKSDHRSVSCGKESESKKKHLLSLLQVVDEQYNRCVDEIHTVVSAFHAVTELDPSLHARFALPTVSAMYRSLRERISSHILAMGSRQSDIATREDSSFETSFIQQQWALQHLKKKDHQLWRPQRGLPERSVSVLRAWMFQNFLHPYPKDGEKHLLALKSGLTRSQVSNWFINARVRLWKPMIEEMYAEMNRRKAAKDQEDGNGGLRNHLLFESRRF